MDDANDALEGVKVAETVEVKLDLPLLLPATIALYEASERGATPKRVDMEDVGSALVGESRLPLLVGGLALEGDPGLTYLETGGASCG